MELPQRHVLRLESSPAAPSEASIWARTLAADHAVPADRIGDLDLCVIELVSNTVFHAYSNGPGEIGLELAFGPGSVSFTIIDSGPPFDPMSVPPHVVPASLEEATIGGLGIHLVRKIAAECHYERRGHENLFTVIVGEESFRPRREERRHAVPAAFPLRRGDGTVVERDQRSGLDRRTLGFISRTKIFRGVAYEDVEAVVRRCRLADYPAGAMVLSPDSQSHKVLVTVRGRLKVHFGGPDSDDGVEIPEGECVGELSVADGKPSSAWVVTAEPCQLLVIEEKVFLEELLAIASVSRNLISLLSERMRRSNESIVARVREVMELEALHRELDFARRIQASMLPANPLLPGCDEIECHGYMRAARQVGGDFYDVLQQGPRRIYFAIGDVCHKGMPAALFMVQAMGLMRAEAAGDREPPGEQLARLARVTNDRLAAPNEAELFVSVFCAILDLDTDKLHYVNVGHNPPLLALPGASPSFLEEPRNPVAGLVSDFDFKVGVVDFPPGSRFLLYTDGVTEAETREGRQFGDEALRRLFRDSRSDSAEDVENIVRRVEDFVANHPQSDDITLLAIRRNDRVG
jgi:serine phosphatase RsbU (regulator of sigma subunit)/anti-sigma regulatory factor (Ser/Thr protein kinase)